MEQNKGIFMLDGLEQIITRAIQTALEVVMPSIMEDYNLEQRNGYGQFRWNAIISLLQKECIHVGWIDFGLCKRGGWVVPVLFHPKTSRLITLMTEERLSDMQRKRDKGKHYLCGASVFNQGLIPQEEQIMMDLPPADGK